MIYNKIFISVLSGFCFLFPLHGLAQALDDSYEESTASPVRLNRNSMAGVGLEPGDLPVSPENLLEGDMKVRRDAAFVGEDFRVVIFESTPARTAHRKPFPIDEFVYILSGTLTLTESNGAVHEFTQGDALVVPTGFAGTWEMKGNYREIAIVPSRPFSFE